MDDRATQLRVGLAMLSSLLVAGILVTLFNEPRKIASTVMPSLFPNANYDVRIRFPEAPNVDTNTPVRKSGIRIGRVSHIALLDEGGVMITADIDGQRRLRKNEVFRTVSDLMGDAVLEVVPGDPTGPKPGGPDESVTRGRLWRASAIVRGVEDAVFRID